MSRLAFKVDATCSGTKARAGRFQTLHGEVQTPVFMPVGTQATVKSQTTESLKSVGSRVLLANTYHLMLRPGIEVFQRFGGIHRFMDWDGPVLTDSGGFQIFSLPLERAMREEGATFISYVDGTRYLLSPETSIGMQRAIGSDIMMVLDQCIPSTAPHDEALAAMELTHRWAVRSLEARGDSPQSLFGIVQGACHEDLRKRSADFLSTLPFDGMAIGGLAVGETHEQRYAFTELVTNFMPATLPRYLMGVGTPLDLLEGVNSGVDMFDCIIPLQLAQRGVVFSSQGKLQLRRACYRLSDEPLDPKCSCHTCRKHSRGYLHHLVKSDEVLGWHLLGLHNLSFYHTLMAEMRQHIIAGDFPVYLAQQREALSQGDTVPAAHNKRKKPAPPPLARKGDYEVVESSHGFSSIRQISSGEVMHSVSKPSDEAKRLYVEQSCLAVRLSESPATAPELVVWDVGLGAASNAMAVLQCFEALHKERAGIVRRLKVISFECDLDPLRLVAKEPGRFEHMRHRAPHTLLGKGSWTHASGLMQWDLKVGDFRDFLETVEKPDIILYDPFSYKTDSELWKAGHFARLLATCAGKGAELYTYSAATGVRVALLRAGFFVGAGFGTGPKAETTVAFTQADGAAKHPGAPKLLGTDWLARWRRSGSKFPADLNEADHPAFERLIEEHPQFKL